MSRRFSLTVKSSIFFMLFNEIWMIISVIYYLLQFFFQDSARCIGLPDILPLVPVYRYENEIRPPSFPPSGPRSITLVGTFDHIHIVFDDQYGMSPFDQSIQTNSSIYECRGNADPVVGSSKHKKGRIGIFPA